ncbi:MAG: SurA N-terminal domain-containing protein [Mangrovicoccus sp.]
MSETTKKSKFSNIVVWVLLALLIIGLAGFGVNGFGTTVHSVGSVGGTVIDARTYAGALEQRLNQLSEQAGETVTISMAEQAGVTQAVLEQQIDRAAMEEAARLAEISVSDELVSQQITNQPSFQGPDGRFDRETYEYLLERNGMTVSSFEDNIRRESSSSLLQRIILGGLTPPQTYGETLFRYVAEARTISYLALTEAELTEAVPAPTEDEVQGYYAAHPDEFTAPALRRITYAWVTPPMLADSLDPSEAELRALYDAEAARFLRPEQRMIQRLGFGSLAEAEAAKAAIEAGEQSFADLVAARNLNEEDVDLGAMTKEQLGRAGEAAFALENAGIAGPVDTDFGPALLNVYAILSADETSFDDAQADLRAIYAAQKGREIIAQEFDGYDDLLAGGASLEELAEQTDMVLGQVDWTGLSFEEGLPLTPEFQNAAGTISMDDFPEILQLGNGGVFALRLDEDVPPMLQPLDDVREAAEAAALADKTRAALRLQAEEILASLENGESFESLGLTPVIRTGLTRGAPAFDLPVAILEPVYSTDAGEVKILEAEDEAAVYLLRVDAVEAPDASSAEAQNMLATVSQETTQAIAQEILVLTAKAVAQQAGVEINQTALNAVHAAFPQ